MHPDDNQHPVIADNHQPSHTSTSDRDRAAAIMREQIDRIYDTPQQNREQSATNSAADNPYEQTHSNQHGHSVSDSQWQRYHTAWQQYYQQYYDRYYRGQHEQFTRQHIAQSSLINSTAKHQAAVTQAITEDRAIDEIRNDLTSKIQQHAKKVRTSRHFVPAISAILVMVIFLFLQYNRVIIAQVKSYVSPGSIAAQNIIIDPTTDTKVSPEPRVIIPKINVDAPVVYEVPSLAEATVQNALKNGVIHYPIPGASANPGEKGNAVFLGHSSNDVFDDGNYKFIFVQLEQIKTGDSFYLHFNGTRYTYTVTATETILPTQVSKLVLPADKPMATLVTCTPVGTAQKRFVVYAEQISPDPTKAATAAVQQPAAQPTAITGNSPTLFDRLFGF